MINKYSKIKLVIKYLLNYPLALLYTELIVSRYLMHDISVFLPNRSTLDADRHTYSLLLLVSEIKISKKRFKLHAI